MTYPIAYMASLLVMGGLDFLWLTNTSAALYRRDLAPLLADDPKMGIAAVFYLTYAAGVVIFGVRPALASQDWRLEQVKVGLNQLRCVAARRSARSRPMSVSGIRSRTATPRVPPERNPKGRGLLRRGFVERLARISDTSFAFLLPTPQNPSGAAIQSNLNLL